MATKQQPLEVLKKFIDFESSALIRSWGLDLGIQKAVRLIISAPSWSVSRLREDETFLSGNVQRLELGENTMEYIYFEGGDKHGSTLDIYGNRSVLRLFFDGNPVFGPPRGEYARADTTIQVAGLERTMWRLVVSQTQ